MAERDSEVPKPKNVSQCASLIRRSHAEHIRGQLPSHFGQECPHKGRSVNAGRSFVEFEDLNFPEMKKERNYYKKSPNLDI